MSSRRVRHRASLKSERLGNETLSTLLGRPSHSLVRTLPPMPPLPLAASCAHLFIPELVLKRRPRQLPDACASHWQCDPNDCGLPVLGTDASTEAAAAAAAPTEATCARHRRHATVSSASLRSPRGVGAVCREAFVQQSAVHPSGHAASAHYGANAGPGSRGSSRCGGGRQRTQFGLVACVTELELPVEALLELRAADAPLRRLRERLPLSAKLLKQARADARPRVRASMGQTKLVRGLLSWRGRRRPAMEEQRTQHVTTCALLDFQFERLGDVQQLCGASFGLGAHRPARDSATGT